MTIRSTSYKFGRLRGVGDGASCRSKTRDDGLCGRDEDLIGPGVVGDISVRGDGTGSDSGEVVAQIVVEGPRRSGKGALFKSAHASAAGKLATELKSKTPTVAPDKVVDDSLSVEQ